MFEIVDGRGTDAGVTGILLAKKSKVDHSTMPLFSEAIQH